MVPKVRREGYLTREQLFTLCQWKSPRRSERAKNNSEIFVREVTQFALSATDERARIESLTLLDAVEFPTASCILHWFHSEQYPILDFRALTSLQIRQPKIYTFKFWRSYVDGWRKLLLDARKISATVTPRMFDQALWQHDKDRKLR